MSKIDVHILHDFQYDTDVDQWRNLPAGKLLQLDVVVAAAVMVAGAGRLPRPADGELATLIALFEAQYGGPLVDPVKIQGTNIIDGTPIVLAVRELQGQVAA